MTDEGRPSTFPTVAHHPSAPLLSSAPGPCLLHPAFSVRRALPSPSTALSGGFYTQDPFPLAESVWGAPRSAMTAVVLLHPRCTIGSMYTELFIRQTNCFRSSLLRTGWHTFQSRARNGLLACAGSADANQPCSSRPKSGWNGWASVKYWAE